MLQLTNGAIHETYQNNSTMTGVHVQNGLTNGTLTTTDNYWPYTQTLYWNHYPVYVCADKTKKAIEILKALQADKQIECKSVPKFIEMVEKIAAIL